MRGGRFGDDVEFSDGVQLFAGLYAGTEYRMSQLEPFLGIGPFCFDTNSDPATSGDYRWTIVIDDPFGPAVDEDDDGGHGGK